MLKIVYKTKTATDGICFNYRGEYDPETVRDFLEGNNKFLWLDGCTFFAIDNIACIFEVDE